MALHSTDFTVPSRFHLPTFYPEARRILKPEGTLAIWGYDTVNIPKQDEANQFLQTFYKETMGPYWSKQRRHIDNHYQGKCCKSFICSCTVT